jgi:hypothetical protein
MQRCDLRDREGKQLGTKVCGLFMVTFDGMRRKDQDLGIWVFREGDNCASQGRKRLPRRKNVRGSIKGYAWVYTEHGPESDTQGTRPDRGLLCLARPQPERPECGM